MFFVSHFCAKKETFQDTHVVSYVVASLSIVVTIYVLFSLLSLSLPSKLHLSNFETINDDENDLFERLHVAFFFFQHF